MSTSNKVTVELADGMMEEQRELIRQLAKQGGTVSIELVMSVDEPELAELVELEIREFCEQAGLDDGSYTVTQVKPG